jgi:hypothetical protein
MARGSRNTYAAMKIRIVLAAVLLGAISFSPVCAETEPLGGQPAPGSKPSVADLDYQVKYQRTFEAVMWAVPAVAILGFRHGEEALGMKDNEIIAYSKPATPSLEALTANNNVPYITAMTELRTGPVVLEVPAATEKASLYGQIVDAWQVTVADVGPAGEDKGKGGKYLLLPDGYDQAIPQGYIPIRTGSMRVYFAFRAVPGPKGSQEEAAAYARNLKMYPLAVAANPPATRFLDPGTRRFPTLPTYDERYFKDIWEIVNTEPVRPRDKVMMGMLASIGIEPGKPFNPDEKSKQAMRQAVVDAYFYMLQRFTNLQLELLYWPDRKYIVYFAPDAERGFKYETDTSVQIDARSWQFFLGTYYPKTLPARPATIYIGPVADSSGAAFVAGATYKITLPKDMPVKQFWSLIVYDQATFAFIYNPLERAGLSMFDMSTMKKNPDGSVTIYIGPKPPTGLESNWIPTGGKQPLPVIRLYGPQQAYFDKTFKLPDFELVK